MAAFPEVAADHRDHDDDDTTNEQHCRLPSVRAGTRCRRFGNRPLARSSLNVRRVEHDDVDAPVARRAAAGSVIRHARAVLAVTGRGQCDRRQPALGHQKLDHARRARGGQFPVRVVLRRRGSAGRRCGLRRAPQTAEPCRIAASLRDHALAPRRLSSARPSANDPVSASEMMVPASASMQIHVNLRLIGRERRELVPRAPMGAAGVGDCDVGAPVGSGPMTRRRPAPSWSAGVDLRGVQRGKTREQQRDDVGVAEQPAIAGRAQACEARAAIQASRFTPPPSGARGARA